MVEFLSKPTTTFAGKSSPLGTFLVILVLVLCILGFYTRHYPHSSSSSSSPASPPQSASHFQHIFLSSAFNSTISSYLRALTLHPHLVGTKLTADTTCYVLNHFKDLGLHTHAVSYNTLLSYPVHSSISAHFSDGSTSELPLTELTQSDQLIEEIDGQ